MSKAISRPGTCGLLCLLMLAVADAGAGQVLKCVDAEGNVTFSDTSCPETTAEQSQQRPAATPAGAETPGASPPGAATGERQGYGEYIDRSRAADQDAPPPDGQ